MDNIIAGIALIASFYVLGKAADLVIVNVRVIGEKLGIRIFFLGIILGFLTSFPELFLGINSMVMDIEEVSLGNLLGGVIVLFGFVMGMSIFYNRSIRTNGQIVDFTLAFVYMLFPLFLGLDGEIGFMDAVILIVVYIYILYIFYIDQKKHNHFETCIKNEGNDILKKILYIVSGLIIVIVMSNVIIRLFVGIMEHYHASMFLMGLVVFSLGTNLPELVVAIRSCYRKVSELSTSNIIGSAIANIFIIGMFALIKPFKVQVDASYYTLVFFTVMIFCCFLHFYRTGNVLTRKEGMVLILLYLFFLILQTGFLIFS